uniref:YggT family protein n=1 Tax=Cyanothece sp. (strain PCC 7425 / ATCC 29141) TaxID=395961 RepID=B8HYJ1_CYAP4
MATEILPLVIKSLANFLQIYLVLLVIRVLLTWFPNVDWYRQPFAILSQLTDPYLNLFRSIIPPLGGIDFSPILAFFLLQFLVGVLTQASGGGVLAFS